jgi:hypothetical protein
MDIGVESGGRLGGGLAAERQGVRQTWALLLAPRCVRESKSADLDTRREALCPVAASRGTKASMADSRTEWEIEKDLDLYKFYLDLLVKAATLVFPITGAMAAYCLANLDKHQIKLGLAVPLLLNAGWAAICALGWKPARKMAAEHNELCREAGFTTPYDLSPLPHLVLTFAIVYGSVAVGLALLLFTRLFV